MEFPDRTMTEDRRDRRLATALFAALLAGSALVASLPWLRAYASPSARWEVVAAAAVSVLLSACVSTVLRARALVGFALSAGVLLLALLVTAGFDLSALASGLVHGPGRLLSETLPLGGSAVACAAVVVVWVVGAAAGEIAFRAGPESHLSGVAFAAPVVSFVLAFAVTVRAPGEDRIAAPLLLVLLAAGALARQRWRVAASTALPSVEPETGPAARDGRVPRLSSRAAAAALRTYRAVGLSALAAVALAAGIPAIPAFGKAPAAVYELPPTDSHLLIDPVAAIGALRDAGNPRRPRLMMRVTTEAASDGYLTEAVMDRFDGSEWTFETTFKPTGGRVPVPPGYTRPAIGTAEVTASTTLLSRLPVPLLPALERPARVDGVPVAADAVNAMLAPAQRLALPIQYTTVSDAPVLTLAGVPTVDGIEASPTTPYAGGDVASSGDLQLPADSANAVGTAARFVAAITGRRPAPTVGFLQQALLALRHDERRLDPTLGSTAGGGGSGGTSLSQVINAVTVNRSATPEQFATFFALVARYLGVPARLATGFRLQPGTGILPPGSYTVSDSEAWTWVEVPVSGMGWVVADPTPTGTTGLSSPPPEQVQATPTTLPAPTANAVPRNQALGGHAVAKPVKIRRHAQSGLPAWAVTTIAVLGVLVVLLVGLGAVVATRRRRSRRRFSNDPALLAGGAWLELLDALTRAGMAIPDGSTSSEIAIEAGRYFGAGIPERVSKVGSTADRAMCSVLDPPDLDTALAAWNSQRELGRDVYRALDRRQRVRMAVALGRHRGSRG